MTRRGLLAAGLALAAEARAEEPGAVPGVGAALERLFRQPAAHAAWFTPTFLSAVPLPRLQAIIDELRQRHGALLTVIEGRGPALLRLEGADIPVRAALDGNGLFTSLLFEPAAPIAPDLDQPVRAIAALPGRTAVLVTTDDQVRADHAADTPLAVGSAFKLAVLRATALACGEARLGWDRVVPLDPAWRSLPSGILQDWPDGTPLTVATLANLMISQSDNTAADALLALVGHGAVEALAPRNAPFLSTRQAFILKTAAKAPLRARWAAGDAAEREAVLREIAGLPPPRPAEIVSAVTSDVEWVFTARELAALLEEVHDLPALRINPGPVHPGPWQAVAFKGGEEVGVLNLSARLVAAGGRRHVVVVTWNNTEALDPQHLLGPFRSLVATLARER